MDKKTIQTLYNEDFYRQQAQVSYQSAVFMLTFLKDILTDLKSVIDVGCGVGTWLKAWKDLNPTIKIAGIDGNSVDERYYQIPLNSYAEVNLTHSYVDILKEITAHFAPPPHNISFVDSIKPFSLVQSLEVAEHIDMVYAENFIDLLTSLGDIVLFSAAIPFQGGTHHINCQPPQYWADKFFARGYVCYDILRPKFWGDERIAWWYWQNSFLYVHKDVKLKNLKKETPTQARHYVAPQMLNGYIAYIQNLLNDRN